MADRQVFKATAKILEAEEITTRSGKVFLAVKTAEREYSCWDDKLWADLHTGYTVQIEYTDTEKNDKTYHNIVAVTAGLPNAQTAAAVHDKQESIYRCKSLDFAAALLHGSGNLGEGLQAMQAAFDWCMSNGQEEQDVPPEPPPGGVSEDDDIPF